MAIVRKVDQLLTAGQRRNGRLGSTCSSEPKVPLPRLRL